MQPVLFLSHGSEDNFSQNISFNHFTHKLSEKLLLRKPEIIICFTSLWSTKELTIGTNFDKEIIFDENLNFDLEKSIYKGGNAIIFSKKMEFYLKSQGIAVKMENRGFDFGTWSASKKLFPQDDIPIVQVSIPESKDLYSYYKLGKLIQNFNKNNALIVVSGGFVYNMRNHMEALEGKSSQLQKSDIEIFSSWIRDSVNENKIKELFQYKYAAPLVNELLDFNDLSHFNSFFIAMGATHLTGLKRMHFSVDNGFSYECFISKSLNSK